MKKKLLKIADILILAVFFIGDVLAILFRYYVDKTGVYGRKPNIVEFYDILETALFFAGFSGFTVLYSGLRVSKCEEDGKPKSLWLVLVFTAVASALMHLYNAFGIFVSAY